MFIRTLSGRSGNARSMLGIDADDGVIDISDDDWASSLEVMDGLTLRGFRLVQKAVAVNFVHCFLEECEFSNVTSDSHFWGAELNWKKCQFSRCVFRNMISPLNRFDGCIFRDCLIEGYRPYQTIFSGCRFESSCIKRMSAVRQGRGKLDELGESALAFIGCEFQGCRFESSRFSGVEFRKCSFEKLEAVGCEFDGIISDSVWWRDVKPGDTFVSFLDEVLSLLENWFGKHSMAYTVTMQYRNDYASKKTQSRDFSACWYDGRVPRDELDVIERRFSQIQDRYVK